MFKCKCGKTAEATDIMPPDTCSCGRGWGGADIVKSPQARSEAVSGESALLCGIRTRLEAVNCDISDYVMDNNGDLSSELITGLINKKAAYELVLKDLAT